MSKVYISAAHKSSGKTTISIGLCAALYQSGLSVQPFKKGPDYIDPLWLTHASRASCYNLDFNTMSDEEIVSKVATNITTADVALIEGNKGLYDGISLDGSDSNAAVAKLIKAPVVLVIDTVGVTRGVAPLLMGYQQFDPDINIAGVIFNKVGGSRHESKMRNAVEEYTDIPFLGAVYKHKQLELVERHLGLMPINESQQADKKIDEIAHLVSQQVDLDKFVQITQQQGNLKLSVNADLNESNLTKAIKREKLRVGICRDSAFGFYYEDDLEAFKNNGADLITINALEDSHLPEQLDGLFIGGGFPETHMDQLSANKSLRDDIRLAIEAGLPTYAECGGLMYLSESLTWEGKTLPMVGIIPAEARMHKKPQGRGYVKLKETDNMLWPGTQQSRTIAAHEFHYSQLHNFRGEEQFAYQVIRGTGITGNKDGWVYKNLLASYTHMRDSNNYHWVKRFVEFIRNHKKGVTI